MLKNYTSYCPDDEQCEGFVEFKERFLIQKSFGCFPVEQKLDWNSLFYKYHFKIGNSEMDWAHSFCRWSVKPKNKKIIDLKKGGE